MLKAHSKEESRLQDNSLNPDSMYSWLVIGKVLLSTRTPGLLSMSTNICPHQTDPLFSLTLTYIVGVPENTKMHKKSGPKKHPN